MEATGHLLGAFGAKSQRNAYETLRSRGIEVRLHAKVVAASATAVDLGDDVIPTRTLVWTAGVRANPLADALGLVQTSGGRILVNDDLSVPGHPDVYVIGDLAAGREPDGDLHPQMAQVAQQGATRVAASSAAGATVSLPPRSGTRTRGSWPPSAETPPWWEVPGGLPLGGRLAWVMWLALHLQRLVGFRNRGRCSASGRGTTSPTIAPPASWSRQPTTSPPVLAPGSRA